MVFLRLDPKLEREFERTAVALGVSKSEYIRNILVEKLEEERNHRAPWDIGQSVFGKFGSGSSNRSADRKKSLKRRFVRKRAVIDSGPLIALFDRHDAHHEKTLAFLRRFKSKLYSTQPMIKSGIDLSKVAKIRTASATIPNYPFASSIFKTG